MRTQATLLLSSLLPLTAGALPAQFVPGLVDATEMPPNADIRRVVLGDYLDQRRLHAVLLDGTTPRFMFSPGIHTSITPLAGWSPTDIATLPAAPGDRADRLLGAGATGLTIAGFIAPQQAGQSQQFQALTLAGGTWLGAQRVIASGDSGSGFAIGVAADGETLIVTSIAQEQAVTTISARMAGPITDLAMVDWNGQGPDEIAVAAGNKIWIYDVGLDVVAVSPAVVAGGRIAVLRDGDQKVAWATKNPSTGVVKLRVFWHDSVSASDVLEGPFDLTLPLANGTTNTFDLVGIVAGQFDSDGLSDVAIVQRTSGQIPILLQFGIGARFRAADARIVDLRDPALPMDLRCNPAVANFDREGSDDLLVPRSDVNSPHVTAIAGLDVGSIAGGVVFDYLNDVPDLDVFSEIALAGENEEYHQLNLHLQMPEVLTEGTFLQIVLWHELYLPSGSVMDSQAISNTVHEITGSSPIRMVTLPIRKTWLPGPGQQPATGQHHVYAEIRFVSADTEQNVLDAEAKATLLVGIAMRPEAANSIPPGWESEAFMTRLSSLATAGAQPRAVVVPGRRLVGGHIVMRKMPATGALPNPGSPTTGNPVHD